MFVNAIDGAREPLDHLKAALDASGVVGTWAWSGSQDQCILDAGAASVLAGDPGLAGTPIRLERAKACVHPDDRDALFRQFRALGRTGGLFVAEYRTLSPSGQLRTILDRGRIFRDAAGTVTHGHGIILDVTESSRAVPIPEAAQQPLERAAGHAIACRSAIDELGVADLRLLVDMLLLRLGQELGRSVRASAGDLH
ncbi:PAS domain-containing protein [Methylobacterium planeticum]|uniref:PAS domain-containing protein n=1 Tax=Methylobacterium planeticum TaxID=2615211 RepID=A0A6N6MMP9_9HYPH|nr:PAS domain-containing protein [Methylobacterium planeticum]